MLHPAAAAVLGCLPGSFVCSSLGSFALCVLMCSLLSFVAPAATATAALELVAASAAVAVVALARREAQNNSQSDIKTEAHRIHGL